tara:strand:+ start:641 stop:2371 length:1731 start_codon:yes stop_codon:yes gene_type:complete
MSKQNISDRPETLDYLLNEKIPISDRLAEHNKYDNLAFITSPSMLYPHFDKLVCGNEDYIKAFYAEKQKAVEAIQEKQRTLDYEAFVRYLFFEIDALQNKQIIYGTKENDWQETVIYDITPKDEVQGEILERVSMERAKANPGTFFKKPSRLRNNNLIIPFISFTALKNAVQESLGKPYADKQQVIVDYQRKYLEPLQEKETNSKAQIIYRNFKTGKAETYKGKDYFYYSDKATVLELLEFEKYLDQIQNENPDNGNKKPNATEITINKIEHYLKGCNCHNISHTTEYKRKDGTPNDTYYSTHLNSIKEAQCKTVDADNSFDAKTKTRIKQFIFRLNVLQEEIIRLLKIACIYEKGKFQFSENEKRGYETSFEIREWKTKEHFTILEYHKSFIRTFTEKNDFVLAIKVQQHSIERIERALRLFKQWYGIDLYKTPLKEDFEKLLTSLKDAINLETVKILTSQTPTVQPQQPNKIELDNTPPVEVKTKYNHIFNNNAFEVWQSMYESFNINESSRSDVKFMFEEMKKDGLIFKTVNQKTFLDWISQTYEIAIQKTSNYSKTPERISIYSNAKQLYKE